MSSLLDSVVNIKEIDISVFDTEFKPRLFNNNRKSKENIFKPKCHRELKKKLKKYKLRKDGQEDPDVLDVSQILVSALKIKSPTNKISNNALNDSEENLKPKNYLSKMGRKKQVIKKRVVAEDGVLIVNNVENVDNEIVSSSSNDTKTKANVKSLDIGKGKMEQIVIDSNKGKDKRQTNAFALMMDSRNKSIGSNSPGKDNIVDELDHQEICERKNIKAKRNLVLQKMAEAKGSLKKKELDELQDKFIEKEMNKRAERLKNMIKSNDVKVVSDEKLSHKAIKSKTDPINNKNIKLSYPKNQLKLVNIFNEPVKNQNSSYNKKEVVTKEEDEFLKKLSPSLKKKENMLCYFKKIEKDEEDTIDLQDEQDNATVIKVKLTSKRKLKLKKKKLSLNRNIIDEDDNPSIIEEQPIINDGIKVKKKDKIIKSNEKKDSTTDKSTKSIDCDLIRPKRNVKRPAKYIDDALLSSSDDELHIFTPKKKKQTDQQNKCVPNNKVSIDQEQTKQSEKCNKETKIVNARKDNAKVIKDTEEQKKLTKLAPIFAVKPQLDAAAIEARQKFLSSGVPDKLKKIIEKQANKSVGLNNFHTVVHVQQQEGMTSETIAEFRTPFNESDSDDKMEENFCKTDLFKKLLISKLEDQNHTEPYLTMNKNKAQVMLQNLKHIHPKFPVHRTYRLLKDKKRGEFKDSSYLDLDNSIEVINGIPDINYESPDKLSWTDKYKAMSSKQLVGNFESTKELKKWLVSWTENDDKLKRNNAGSDSSDFYLSDTDSKDSMKSTNNLLVVTGPVGSGKTSLVYAVAAELAIKVLEVNASTKRTGKIMLQDLQEATQSHKVNRGKSSQDSSQKSQEIIQNEKPKVYKKRGRPKKSFEGIAKKTKESIIKNDVLSQPSSSQDSVRTCMSLILIDDADIVFDQDDGFCSAIVQLVQSSKRPVILITSSKSCLHLQRFFQCAKIINTRPFHPKMLGPWLDIMCLADSGACWPGLGAKCLDYFNGDIRRTINFLQFRTARHSMTEDENSPQIDDYKITLEDENSNISWSDHEGTDENEKIRENILDNNIWKYFMNDQGINVFKIWWNVPRLLISPIKLNRGDKKNKINSSEVKSKKIVELDEIANVVDMISFSDSYFYSSRETESELISVPWFNYESNSVSEQENLQEYDRNIEIGDDISNNLLSASLMNAQNSLGLELQTDFEFPGMASKRERSRIVTRHNNLSSFLNQSAILDRRALALDYWSGCRTICRVEKTRTDSNLKRNNRFCNYLKSVNILCTSDAFDSLANSLNCKKGDIQD